MTPLDLPRVVPYRKMDSYLLNPIHPVGRSKAAYFARFGFTREDWSTAASALVGHGETNPVVETRHEAHGVLYAHRCTVETPDGRNPCIVTVWIHRHGEDVLSFVTAYPAE